MTLFPIVIGGRVNLATVMAKNASSLATWKRTVWSCYIVIGATGMTSLVKHILIIRTFVNIVYVSIRRAVFNALSKVFQPLSAVLQQKSLEGNNVEKHNDCILLQRSTFIENMRSNKILFSFEDYNRPTTATTTTTMATTTSTSKPVTTATLSEYFITRSWITIDPKIYKK